MVDFPSVRGVVPKSQTPRKITYTSIVRAVDHFSDAPSTRGGVVSTALDRQTDYRAKLTLTFLSD